jgi:hypothetical protein
VSLIDCRNSCDRAGLVIEDLVSHMRSNAEARHSRNACPAQIMKAPSGDLGKFVEVAFGNRKVLEWFGPMHSKYIRPPASPRASGRRSIDPGSSKLAA